MNIGSNNQNDKKSKQRKLILIASLLTVLILTGVSYAYFKARVNKINETGTNIRTNVLGLIYTGVHEVDIDDIIPGDSFAKTFTVENVSNRAVDFNLYIEKITSTFNEDLKITVVDDKGNTVVSKRAMPGTNEGKEYIATSIPIESGELISYTMTIEYEYSEEDQSDYMGASFQGHVMIDTEPLSTVVTLSTLPNGTAVYYNPVTNEKCSDYTSSNSEIGVTTGCLKWYAYNDTESSETINLLLDHNLSSTDVSSDNAQSTIESIAEENNWNSSINPSVLKYSDISSSFSSIYGAGSTNPKINGGGYYAIHGSESDWLYSNMSFDGNDMESRASYGAYFVEDEYDMYIASTFKKIAPSYSSGYSDDNEDYNVNRRLFRVNSENSGVRPTVTIQKSIISSSYKVKQTTSNNTILADGTVVYYNPVTNQKCNNYTSANSASGVNAGCLKWYVYNDSKDRDRVNLLLDHNIDENVGERCIENCDSGGFAPGVPSRVYSTQEDEIANSLATNTSSWKKELNPRLIKFQDIYKYFDGKQDYDYAKTYMNSNWIYDNVDIIDLEDSDDNKVGYYFLEKSPLNYRGVRSYKGEIEGSYGSGYGTANDPIFRKLDYAGFNGIRPTITVYKSTLGISSDLESIAEIESCPGCVYSYYTDTKRYDNNASTLTNYTRDYSTLNEPIFLGHVLDSDGKIRRSYVCGVMNYDRLYEIPFCVESVSDFNWEWVSVYSNTDTRATELAADFYTINSSLLEKAATASNNSCTELSDSLTCSDGEITVTLTSSNQITISNGTNTCTSYNGEMHC